MKLVINNCYGDFNINKVIARAYGLDPRHVKRDNPILITLIESGVNCDGDYAELKVVDIPDNATDYELTEYDGWESIIYVVNGMIHHL